MGTLIKVRPNGEVLKYDAVINTFGVMTAAGVSKTMFRSDGTEMQEIITYKQNGTQKYQEQSKLILFG